MAEILYKLAAEILKNLGSLAAQEVGSLRGVEAELRKLSATVSSIQAVLLDAEEKQRSSHEVKDWISKLKTVFYEADDLLDDFSTEVTHRKLVNKKVSIFFSRSNPMLYNVKISKRLKAIRENLDAIAKDKAALNLVERQQPETNSMQMNLDRETYSFVPEGEVIGRNDDKKIIADFLLDSEVQENVAVVSIVGFGGLGKTTLAQYVFNDERVQSNFEKKLWVCVSDVFEVKLIAEKIIESASGEKANYLQLDAVQNQLRNVLDGKKYLLVLDDVWNEDASKWSKLKNMLIGGANGSKILVTTRSDVVAQVSGSVHQHKLGDLPEEEAWALFAKMAFECNTESENSNLVEIGKEIVKKCAGVPLAIRSVGSLLRLKRTETEWTYFKNQDFLSITGGDDNVMAILRLSYNHLPRHLKLCFAYCSLFPKDFMIPRVDLIDMWMSQGFIQSTTSSRDMEDVANSYFMDLLRRSFFQKANERTCKMHDLIHDLAKEVSDREFFSITNIEDTEIAPEQTLHASCSFKFDGSLTFPDSFYRKHKKLRTFINLYGYGGAASNSLLERMISSFERMRVLYLRRFKINFLPQSLGGLKHLRYLVIYSDTIVSLPNSITKLHNLQVLKLYGCRELKELPIDIWRLVSLRRLECQGISLTHIPPGLWQLANLLHLDFDSCYSLEDMPPGIGQLTSLRTLTKFVVGKESCTSGLLGDRLNELKGLVDLRGKLTIKFNGRVHAIGDIMPTDVVKGMKHLRSLSIDFVFRNDEDDTRFDDLKMLDALHPHQNTESLQIVNYGGSRFPSWLMVENLNFLLPNLVELRIQGNRLKCQKVPPLWQLRSLQILSLWKVDFVENLDELEGDDKFMLPTTTPTDEHYFPSLKELKLGIRRGKIMKQILCPPHHPSPLCNLKRLTLSFDDVATMPEDVFRSLTSLKYLKIVKCKNLVSLSTSLTHLTSLNRLHFHACPMLTSLPEGMRSLTALQRLRIIRCSSSLKQRCKEGGEDWPKIAHIPYVYIYAS